VEVCCLSKNDASLRLLRTTINGYTPLSAVPSVYTVSKLGAWIQQLGAIGYPSVIRLSILCHKTQGNVNPDLVVRSWLRFTLHSNNDIIDSRRLCAPRCHSDVFHVPSLARTLYETTTSNSTRGSPHPFCGEQDSEQYAHDARPTNLELPYHHDGLPASTMCSS
jgi:hypothetical protein